MRVKGGTGGQLSAEGGRGIEDHQVLFFLFLSGFRLLLSRALPSLCDLAASSIAASLLRVSGTVRLSSPLFSVLEENLSIFFGVFFWGFSLVPFSARRIGFSPQWKLCASVETSLDHDDDDDVFSGLSCYAQVCLGCVFFFFFFGLALLYEVLFFAGGSRSGWIRFVVRFARFSKG